MRQFRKLLSVSLVITGLLFTSCIKEEDLNVEADIITASIENAESLLITQPTVKNDEIIFRLIEEPGDNSYLFAPTFLISSGAIISPESGTELDFSTPQEYVVISENGQSKKTYTVRFFVDRGVLTSYSFEDVEVFKTTNPTGNYHKFFTPLGNGSLKRDWDSGNHGYNMLAETLLEEGEEFTPAVYPTAQVDNGFSGKGVKMQTKSTGVLGAFMGSPLAAGNLFLGEFELDPADPLGSTKFGQPYTYLTAPVAMKAYFKYKAGPKFKVNKKPSALEKDTWDAYAILFEKSEEDNFLRGDHEFTDSRIVSVARLSDAQRVETDEWTPFEIKFENVEGKSFSSSKEYMFTIVFSSSIEGAYFNGAVGSALWIDEVEIVLAD